MLAVVAGTVTVTEEGTGESPLCNPDSDQELNNFRHCIGLL